MDASAARELNEILRARRDGEPVRAHFPGRDLSEVLALAADLAGANFEGANLENACLAGSKLTRANLRGANLRGVDLDGADLTEADLSGADLTAARLDDSVLTRAKLAGTCLESTLGDPLSMTGALVDKNTIARSRFRMRDIAQLVIRGADVREDAELSQKDSVPPSEARLPTSTRPSIVPRLRALEIEYRDLRAQEDEEVPASLRAFKEMETLIKEARTSDAPPPSLRPRPPTSSRSPAALPLSSGDVAPHDEKFPDLGDTYLGIVLEKELFGGTNSRTYLGRSASGERLIAKLFDPECPSAEMQLPAFQRGLRALNRLQASGDPNLSVAELVAVATDLSGYVVRYYDNGSIENLVDVAMTMQGGIDIIKSLATTIHAMNEHGVLVRSIKPRNVLIDGLTPVIGEVDMVDLPTLATNRGDISGYGSYAAPEELVGTGTRSPTADVYAVGKLLEYLLTGHEPIAPIGAPPLIADRPGMSPVLVDIVKRCIAKDPADRYQYLSEFLEDLEEFERKGARAALRASIRPGMLSRLNAAPSLQNAPASPKDKKEKANEQKELPLPTNWLGRRIELLLATTGLLTTLATLAIFLLAPSSVEKLEFVSWIVAPLIGFLPWYLPMPRRRTALLRLLAWAGTAALVYTSDPARLATIRWRHDLTAGTLAEREIAARNLIRVGDRSLAGADLSNISLVKTDVSSVDFSGANLEKVDFSNAFAMDAKFDNAKIGGANFRGADLRGTSWQGASGFASAACNGLTRLPDKALYCVKGTLRIPRPR